MRLKLFVVLVLFFQISFAQSEAEQLFINATDRLMTTNLRMSLNKKTTDKKGRVKDKSFDVTLAKFGEEEKIKMVMKAPERAAGITIVVSKQPASEGVIEVYTPANGKTRKMIANEKNMATVGSDFAFSGYSPTKREKLSVLLKEKKELRGRKCSILEIKDGEKVDGGRAELAVVDESLDIIQIKTYDENGTQITITELFEYKEIEGARGKVQPRIVKTNTMENNQFSEIEIVDIAALKSPKKEDFLIEADGAVKKEN